MATKALAIFGKPVTSNTAGGVSIGVDVLTLYKGKVVLFEKPGQPGGVDLSNLWFPWDFLMYGEAPEVAAKRILKTWGKAEGKALVLVEPYSMQLPGEEWQLRFRYVTEIKAAPKPGPDIKEIKIIEIDKLPRMVGILRRSDIRKYLSLAGKI